MQDVERGKKVLCVLAGQDMPLGQLATWANSADVVLAADAGADRLLAAGVKPDITIGDLDSTDLDPRRKDLDIRLSEDQDSTDCDKVLGLARDLGHRQVTLASVEGDRADHFLATLHSASRIDLYIRIALRTGLGIIHRGPTRSLVRTGVGRRLSLLPITMCRGVTLEGVVWPLIDSDLDPLGQISISNRSASEAVSLDMSEGTALLVIAYEPQEMPSWT